MAEVAVLPVEDEDLGDGVVLKAVFEDSLFSAVSRGSGYGFLTVDFGLV